MSYFFIEQRDRIIELERMLSNLIDRNKSLEEELKRASSYVGRLESRVDFLEMNEMPKAVLIQRLIEKFIHGLENDASEVAKEIKELMAEKPIPKRYTEEDWLVLQEAKDLLDELETEDEQDET